MKQPLQLQRSTEYAPSVQGEIDAQSLLFAAQRGFGQGDR